MILAEMSVRFVAKTCSLSGVNGEFGRSDELLDSCGYRQLHHGTIFLIIVQWDDFGFHPTRMKPGRRGNLGAYHACREELHTRLAENGLLGACFHLCRLLIFIHAGLAV